MKCRVGRTIPTPELRLFHSRDNMASWCVRHGIPCNEFLDADAQTWTWRNGTKVIAIVLFENMADDVSDAALLAHEATHVALNTLEMMGEDDCGDETLVYLVQGVTKALLHSHRKWTRKRCKKQ